jgi:hypothetical protein
MCLEISLLGTFQFREQKEAKSGNEECGEPVEYCVWSNIPSWMGTKYSQWNNFTCDNLLCVSDMNKQLQQSLHIVIAQHYQALKQL